MSIKASLCYDLHWDIIYRQLVAPPVLASLTSCYKTHDQLGHTTELHAFVTSNSLYNDKDTKINLSSTYSSLPPFAGEKLWESNIKILAVCIIK